MTQNNNVHTQMPHQVIQTKSLRPVIIWLYVMCLLVALMVIVGGATRLTDSGLSITEWKPVVGAIPPLSEEKWLEEFEKYKQIPEYQEVNFGMSMGEFKEIYWWEWGHRFLGRLIGIVFLIPMIIFIGTKRVTGDLRWKLLGLFVLGGAQGALGWYMVKSGLTERVDVSQYRLAAHLGLAIFLFALIAWLAMSLSHNEKMRFFLDSKKENQGRKVATGSIPKNIQFGSLLLLGGVYGQIILGAFVAGLRAGKTYTDWPLMDGRFFPAGYFSENPDFFDLFETIAAVQFNHRLGAYILVVAAALFFVQLGNTHLKRPAGWLLMAMGFQILLGIAALMNAVPLWLGLFHQAGALIVLLAAIHLAMCSRRELRSHSLVA